MLFLMKILGEVNACGEVMWFEFIILECQIEWHSLPFVYIGKLSWVLAWLFDFHLRRNLNKQIDALVLTIVWVTFCATRKVVFG